MDEARETTHFEIIDKIVAPRLPRDPSPKRFKVLLVYPNYSMVNLLPTNIGILTACLRQNGFDVGLFDTTFYRTTEKTLDEIRVENLQVRKFNLEEFGVRFKPGNYLEDFRKKVEEFQPDLIGVSVVEDTWPQGKELIEAVRDHPALVIVGGVFATLAPEVPLRCPDVDMICIGEGEYAIVELATRLWKGQGYTDIKNLWVKRDRDVIKNPMNPPIPMDEVPFGDFDLFEKERFFRPMQGKIMRMAPIETDRGCPYKCRFCEAPSLVNIYRENTGQYYFRRRSWGKVREEIEEYKRRYDINYIYFNSETFLAMGEEEFDEFVAMYKEIKLPFWMQTRIETLNDKRIRALEEVNCNRISIGLEHGNEPFRNDIVGKGFSNQRIIETFKLFRNSMIPTTINNILGFPGESRALIFDTIELNRHLCSDSVNAYYFTPYRGTAMRKDAVEKGYVTEDQEAGAVITGKFALNLPTISREEIMGLVRTFSLYVKFPKEEWPEIALAERFTPEGNAKFAELSKRYYERFFDHDFKQTKKSCMTSHSYEAVKSITEDLPC
ncbi:MAG: B12-binding domain-containing radical SAM protein [Nitrospira sp.]|nr:B12-binding domain-containing radical SAM protein [Nitrospira sp.]